ncbi:hypothetical protein VNO78_23846 [Psophocarpus tetragonolobus]|uniref:FH2 domain-containing protein n=1 Tax=Psophocarpus tetragonolobus TaxID=3891 RepID=A0AAN9S576_PSOTE
MLQQFNLLSIVDVPLAHPPAPHDPLKVQGKPTLLPKEKAKIKNTTKVMVGMSSRGNGAHQTRLKPLYWDKVAANVDHSTVGDQISDGSLCGNPNKLADAGSFLYHILRAVPTGFILSKTLLFRSCYDCEVVQLKEHLKTLEMGCNEMKITNLLLKFLEAILKAGNRMNAGTSRGNAHGFKLCLKEDNKLLIKSTIFRVVLVKQATLVNHILRVSNDRVASFRRAKG